METASVTYLGELRTEALHTRSGDKVITDAPPDNQGRGEAFSPTDLLSTSLACCMMTLMGIAAREKDIPLNGLSAKVYKHMSAAPRKVERVEVHMTMDGEGLGARERTILETAARTCPVARSLHPDLLQDISFTYR
ncbi:MAG: OsmC family protein [Flavobacteriales bacterium]|nr:OsmC family protein [Flavobacteriales bacterium]MBP6642719.1 OsmC family protein [Flavobacteriales bacterium]MBP7156217.1 OsmC family protein [Flavobacteriales bacterium]HQV75977.1 OsmC family protein [Flavobacteriales bacterium]HQW39985.1 OsmC family protein [Flavobacteriales bacterium]